MADESISPPAAEAGGQPFPSLSDPPKMTPLLTGTSYPAALWSGKQLRIRWANTPFLRLLGAPPRFDALGMPVRGFLADTGSATRCLDAAYTGQPQTDSEYEHVASDGRVSYWHLTYHPVPAGIGDPYDVLITAVDVTMRAKSRRAAAEDIIELRRSGDLIDTTILSSMDAEEILQRVVVEATEAFGADWGWLAEREPAAWAFRSVHGWPAEIVGMSFAEDELSLPRLAAEAGTVVASASRGAADPEHRALMERHDIGAFLLVPVISRGEVTGVLGFCWARFAHMSDAMLDVARKLEVSLSLALENARTYTAERELSRTLQSAYLRVPKQVDGIEFAHLYHSASAGLRVGGDFFDIVQAGAGRVGILIGGVDARGVDAVQSSFTLKTALRSDAMLALEPEAIVARTNELLLRDPELGRRASAFCGMLDTDTGDLRYCSAGQSGPVVVRHGVRPFVLNGLQDPMGLRSDITYAGNGTRVELGDLLVFCTDGVVWTEDENGRPYGMERLLNLADTLREEPTATVPESVFMDVFSHSRGSLDDDLAIVAVRRVA